MNNIAPKKNWIFLVAALFFLPLYFSPLVLADREAKLPTQAEAAQSAEVEALLSLPVYDLEIAHANLKSFKVGDQIEFKILGFDIQAIGEFALENFPGADVLESQGLHIQVAANQVFVIPLKSGSLQLPSLIIKNATGKQVGRTRPFLLQVGSAILSGDPDPQKPAALRSPLKLPLPIWVFFVLVLTLLILALGFILILIYLNKKKKLKASRAFVATPLPIRPEDEIALEALVLLEKEGLMSHGKYKPYFFSVSEILKIYLGKRYQFDACESTAQEILEVFENRHLVSDDLLRNLRDLFEHLDLVKFTDYFPAQEEGGQVLEGARAFILKTRRVVAPPVAVLPNIYSRSGQHAI